MFSGYVLTPLRKAEYYRETLDKMNKDIPLQRLGMALALEKRLAEAGASIA